MIVSSLNLQYDESGSSQHIIFIIIPTSTLLSSPQLSRLSSFLVGVLRLLLPQRGARSSPDISFPHSLDPDAASGELIWLSSSPSSSSNTINFHLKVSFFTVQESFLPCPWTNKFALIFVSLNLPSHIFATVQIHGQGMQCTLYYLASGSRFGIAGYFENSPCRAKLQLFRCAIISTSSHWSILFSI